MENEKMMDKQGMTAEREMEILEAVAEALGKERCAVRLGKQLDRTCGASRQYTAATRTGYDEDEAIWQLQNEMAKLGVWLNILSLIVGEPVKEEIAYLEELAEEVGPDGR